MNNPERKEADVDVKRYRHWIATNLIHDHNEGEFVLFTDHQQAIEAAKRAARVQALEDMRFEFQSLAHHVIDEELWRFDEAIRKLKESK